MTETVVNTENKAGYKKTKLGWIPEDWEILPLQDLAKIDSESLNSKTPKNYRFKYISLSDVDSGTINNQLEEYSYCNSPSRAKRILNEDDVLMATVRPNLKAFAHINFSPENLVASTGFSVISTRKELFSEFFFHYLFSLLAEKQFYSFVVGSNYPALNNSDIKNFKVALPSLPEQKKIAEILSTWDKTISKTEKLINAKKRYKKGLMQRLLSGRVRFPGFVKSEDLRKTRFGIYPKDWEYKKIQEVATEVNSKVGDKMEDYTVMSCTKHDGLVSSLQYFDRQVFSKDISNYKAVEKGEFAYATNHVEEGSIGYNNWCEKGAISPMYTVFKADQNKIDNDYLYAILKTENYRRVFEIFTNGTVNRRGSLRWKDFKKIKVPVPSLEEQKAISKVLKKGEQEIQLLEKQLEKYQQQKKGLMQQLLTGKVRVN